MYLDIKSDLLQLEISVNIFREVKIIGDRILIYLLSCSSNKLLSFFVHLCVKKGCGSFFNGYFDLIHVYILAIQKGGREYINGYFEVENI